MARVVGFDEKVVKRFTCSECGAIVEYSPNEEELAGWDDEFVRIKGLRCPNCGNFHRTNP